MKQQIKRYASFDESSDTRYLPQKDRNLESTYTESKKDVVISVK
jgi:hypothetical protein